ncbi:MAG: type II toxin-antitoxin system VapB family antitoxin [Methylobacterium mesophilicum]|nr:type II toxin-antitoxin system VapB family antitoxin [Methylobacterium mesophilicum]
MGMNIKSDEVERLVRQLADETGESLTEAIRRSVEERLARFQRERDVAERIRKIDALLANLPPVPPGVTSDHSDLYDEDGLPA